MTLAELQAIAAAFGHILTTDPSGRFVLDDNKGGKVWYDSLDQVEQRLGELDAAGQGLQGEPAPKTAAPQQPRTPLEALKAWWNRFVEQEKAYADRLGKQLAGEPEVPPPPLEPPPPEPPDWAKFSDGRDYNAFFQNINGVRVLNPDLRPDFNDIMRRIDAYTATQERAKAAEVATTERAKAAAIVAEAKVKPTAAQPEIITYNGERFWRPDPTAPWQHIGKAGQSLDQALQEAVTAKNPDWAEFDRLIAARDKIETTSPGYLQRERAAEETRRQNEIKNQQDQAKLALEVQQQAIARAQSPGDWLAWWDMMQRTGQPTAQQFQQFGANRFQPSYLGGPPGAVGQPGAPAQVPAAPTPTYAQVQQRLAERGEGFGNLVPLGLQTRNPMVAAELLRRQGAPESAISAFEQPAGTPAVAQPTSPPQGLNWLNVAYGGGSNPTPSRQIPSIPGAPQFLSGQGWNALLPSQQEGYQAAVKSTGIPWMDFLEQWRKTFPTGNVSPGYSFQPAPQTNMVR